MDAFTARLKKWRAQAAMRQDREIARSSSAANAEQRAQANANAADWKIVKDYLDAIIWKRGGD
jgi:hypothetical protein